MNLVPILDPRRSQHRPLVLFVVLMAIVGLACAISLAVVSLGRRGQPAPERSFEAVAFFPPEFETLLRAYDALAVDLLGPTPTP
ncbi:MAG: hypothetical protein K1X50_12860 [Candidatus Promineofilum sp.]|nr:hypothetical protein [Promineifilum sp.]MCW5864026.1 hypothetical protein [Anaerolineae bacterium]